MIIKYIKEESLLTLKRNKGHVFDLMKNSVSNEWVKDYLGEDCFANSKIKVNEFTMNTTNPKAIDSDFENAKILYDALKGLNETQAIDERLWAGLAFGECYDYLRYRWGLSDITRLQYRWLFYTDYKRKLFYNGLSRLWWFAHMTYDKNLQNPYELTEFAFSYPQIMKAMTYRNYSNSDKIRKVILRSFKKYAEIGGNITTKLIDKMYIYISLLGGVSVIDAYDNEDLEFLLFDFMSQHGDISE